MIGEIRDHETAQIAIRASLTGHLVLSTIHANNSFSIFSRLLEMGLPYYQVKNALHLCISQRLIRKTCIKCAGSGCESCFQTGFSGRVPVFEFFDTKTIPNHIIESDILNFDVQNSGGNLFENCKNLVARKITTHNEIKHVQS
jgi:general secretion pathway protein E